MLRRVLAGLLALAAGVAVAPAAVAEQPAVVLTVTPADGLIDGTPVVVTGQGLPADAQLLVAQCAGAELSSCAQLFPQYGYAPPNVALPRTDASGGFEVRMRMAHVVSSGDGPLVCDAPSCAVVAVVVSGITEVARVPISVGADTYLWPTPTAELDIPAAGVVDHQSVAATGDGYSPWINPLSPKLGGAAWSEVCRAVPDVDPAQDCTPAPSPSGGPCWAEIVGVDGAGHLDGTIALRRHLELPDGAWDCAIGGCTVALTQFGNPRSARIPIPWAPEWAPWPSASAFLAAAFTGMVDRSPTPTEVALLTPMLTERSLTAVDLLLVLAAEADATVGEVTRQYVAFFGRRPDTAGLRYWVGRLRAGATTQSLWRAYGGTAELRSTYAGLSAGQIVDRAFLRTLGRTADAEGRAYWVGRIQQGLPVASAVGLIARSAEFRRREADHAAVTALSFGLGGRLAPTAEQWSLAPRLVARDLIVASSP